VEPFTAPGNGAPPGREDSESCFHRHETRSSRHHLMTRARTGINRTSGMVLGLMGFDGARRSIMPVSAIDKS